MQKKHSLWDKLMEQTAHGAESVLCHTIVEIAGEKRVLIENHQGVTAYDKERIQIKVGYGSIHIIGRDLEILHMTKDQLVVCGHIQDISLHRRDTLE